MFRRKTVDSILSSLNQNINDLLTFAEVQSDLADAEEEQASALVASANARRGEVLRADLVAGKLKSLIA